MSDILGEARPKIEELMENSLIHKIISRQYRFFKNIFDSIDDARQEAYVCLLESVNKYIVPELQKNDKKCCFNTYFTNNLRYRFIGIYRNKKKEWAFKQKMQENIALLHDKFIVNSFPDYSKNFIGEMKSLRPIDKNMLYGYFYEDKTLAELGEEFGVSKQRVSLRIKQALQKIKDIHFKKEL